MKDYMNHPMMDMFKKYMQNPMMQGFDANNENNGFNPAAFMNMSNKFAENMPWLKAWMPKSENPTNNAFNFSENMANVEEFASLHKLSLENAQAMLRRQAEIIQKHAGDLYKLMQNAVSSASPEAVMSMQADYIHSTFDSLVSDFKELSEMCSKAHIESFEAVSDKISQQMKKAKKTMCSSNAEERSSCSSETEENQTKKSSAKK
jgi:phasin family protein